MTDATWELVVEELSLDEDEPGVVRAVTDRLRVPGGWLYRSTRINPSHSADFSMPDTVALAFVSASAESEAR